MKPSANYSTEPTVCLRRVGEEVGGGGGDQSWQSTLPQDVDGCYQSVVYEQFFLLGEDVRTIKKKLEKMTVDVSVSRWIIVSLTPMVKRDVLTSIIFGDWPFFISTTDLAKRRDYS